MFTILSAAALAGLIVLVPMLVLQIAIYRRLCKVFEKTVNGLMAASKDKWIAVGIQQGSQAAQARKEAIQANRSDAYAKGVADERGSRPAPLGES